MTDQPETAQAPSPHVDTQPGKPGKPPPDTSWIQTTEVRESDQQRQKRQG